MRLRACLFALYAKLRQSVMVFTVALVPCFCVLFLFQVTRVQVKYWTRVSGKMKAGAVKACKQRGKHCSAASHRPFLACCTTSKKEKKRKTRVFLFPLLEDNVMLLLLFFFPLQCSCAYFLFHNKHLSPLINEKPTTLPVLRTTLSFFFLFFFSQFGFLFSCFFFFDLSFIEVSNADLKACVRFFSLLICTVPLTVLLG